MTRLADLSIRVRVTAAFAVVITVLLAGISVALYHAMSSALLDEIDTGLRFRANNLASEPQTSVTEHRIGSLEEPAESFDQLVDLNGAVLRVTPGLPRAPWVPLPELRRVTGPAFYRVALAGVADGARLMAIRLSGTDRGKVLVVGASMSDRADALNLLVVVLLAGGAVAVALACAAGWLTAGISLRPMERIRRQASAITASGIDRRLELPATNDELRRLAETLNDLLSRLDSALAAERRFIARASHELRTPLAALKAELDLARSRPRSADELRAAVESAAAETDRLVRLANDLLTMARSDAELPIQRAPTNLRGLVLTAVELFAPRAAAADVELVWRASDATVAVDATRVRQALDNLLDNALRHTPRGGKVVVTAEVAGGTARISVTDTGPGFDLSAAEDGRGMGLRIVRSIAAGHGGHVSAEPGAGASIVLVLADATAS
jgi:signal transduction histidine kinase